MNILHINTTDSGGAGKACLRIHLALLKKGINSKMLVLHKSTNEDEVYKFNYWDNTYNKIQSITKGIKYFLYDRNLRHRKFTLPLKPEIFTFPSTIYDITTHPLYLNADIVQLNWVSGFLDEPSFFAKNKKPVIWRMADLYITGGGYHYEKGFPFDAYKKYIEENIKKRKKCLKNTNLHIVPISNWTKQKAEESDLVKMFPMNIIQCGLEKDIFKIYERKAIRNILGLPLNKKIILFGADYLGNPRKGTLLLIKALEKIENHNNLYICSFGSTIPLKTNNFKIHSLGKIRDDRLLAMFYSAADLFITPSLEETFGQTLIEAISCGTPIVSFPTGGGLDVCKSEFNGILANDFTEDSLYKAINKAINTHFDREKIHQDIIDRFNIDDKANEYIELYKKIMANYK